MTKPKAKAATQQNGIPLEARVIRSISDFPAPKTTQDAVDKAAAEYATANLIRQYAVKRYDRAKSEIVDAYEERIAEVRGLAHKNMAKASYTVIGADWQITLHASKPVVRVDANDLRTALVKRGVNADMIDEAMKEVEKRNAPALSIEAAPALAE